MKKQRSKFLAAIFMLAVTVLVTLDVNGISVQAAEYKGKGSKTDPYIVETAEQLNDIRNNLKAHYKLGNTIDLSSFENFKPIGNLSEPFTGSLSCDLDESGKPKYAIKNLKMTVAPAGSTLAEKYSRYKENKSGWEAGLFGYTKGGTFKNILVLDASVTNKVEGNYQMNSDFSINPGCDEQATGILVGIAENATVSGCGVSGTVTSATNYVGGMIGRMVKGKVSKCYAYATVTSTGSWGSGGLVGSAINATINTSFFSGTFSGGKTHAGAFVGDGFTSKVTDCYAEGIVKTKNSGCFFGVKNHADENSYTNLDVCTNCYTTAVIEGRTNAQTNKTVKNNNYITDAAGGLEIGFAAANMAEINTAFQSLANWTVTSGSWPQIKGLVPVKDASAYTVQEVTAGNEETTTPGNEETTTPGEEQDGTETVNGEEKTDVVVHTEFNNTVTKLQGSEWIIVIVLSAVVGVTLVASFVVCAIAIRSNLKKKTKGGGRQ